MLSCWMNLFELSFCWLAGADADNAGVVWALGWPAWVVARLAAHHQSMAGCTQTLSERLLAFAWPWSVQNPSSWAACHVCLTCERLSAGWEEVTAAEGCPNWCWEDRKRGSGGTDGRLSVRCRDANNPRNSETLTRRGRGMFDHQLNQRNKQRGKEN